MRTLVTLDPEYIPWAPSAPEVKLRRKRNKFVSAALPIVMGILVIGGIWLFVNRGTLSQGDGVGTAATSTVAGGTATDSREGESVAASPAPADVLSVGRPGALALRRGNSVTFLTCATYTATVGAQVYAGNTAGGPVINCGDLTTEVMCDGAAITF